MGWYLRCDVPQCAWPNLVVSRHSGGSSDLGSRHLLVHDSQNRTLISSDIVLANAALRKRPPYMDEACTVRVNPVLAGQRGCFDVEHGRHLQPSSVVIFDKPRVVVVGEITLNPAIGSRLWYYSASLGGYTSGTSVVFPEREAICTSHFVDTFPESRPPARLLYIGYLVPRPVDLTLRRVIDVARPLREPIRRAPGEPSRTRLSVVRA